MSELLVEGLAKNFPVRRGVFSRSGTLKAVDGVSFEISRGETLGLVGESGCGKSTVGRCIVRLTEPTSGTVRFAGMNTAELSGRKLKEYRRRVQFVFQDSHGSLNPRMTVREMVEEPLVIHRVGTRGDRRELVHETLGAVGLGEECMDRFPHELSGGQRQRVGIARSLVLRPSLLVCDEPTSALDVSIRAQVANLLQQLQAEYGLTYLFMGHDLSLMRRLCDRVAVMYLGKIVEIGRRENIYTSAGHPYTQALLSALPGLAGKSGRKRRRIVLKGEIPSAAAPPSGCKFHTRCPIAQLPLCADLEPPLRELADDHQAACHLAQPGGVDIPH
jgi:oligopeptide transport system ATP-binding protein